MFRTQWMVHVMLSTASTYWPFCLPGTLDIFFLLLGIRYDSVFYCASFNMTTEHNQMTRHCDSRKITIVFDHCPLNHPCISEVCFPGGSREDDPVERSPPLPGTLHTCCYIHRHRCASVCPSGTSIKLLDTESLICSNLFSSSRRQQPQTPQYLQPPPPDNQGSA